MPLLGMLIPLFGMLLSANPLAATANEGDWPQWRGPTRDGHAADQELLETWPKQGPRPSWQFSEAGRGFSSVVVSDDQLFTLGSAEGRCFAICLNLADGSLRWKTDFSPTGTGDDYDLGWGGGPRSTPALSASRLFALSDLGIAACLERSSGQLVWSRNLVTDEGGEIPDWGYSDSPLIDGDRVLFTPGRENFLVALNRRTGDRVWSSSGVGDSAQYVSVMKGAVGQTRYYLTANQEGLLAFDANSGEKLFANTATGNNVAVVSTPIIHDDWVYHSSGYGGGNVLLRLREAEGGSLEVEQQYHLTGRTMRNHHGGVILADGVIYGFTEANRGLWMAQELSSGLSLWEERLRPNRSGSICFADGHLYCYNDAEGSIVLVEADRRGWKQKGELTLPQRSRLDRGKGAIWSHPVVARGKLIIRDQEVIHAFDIAAAAK
jgi:outer membrane protein assembly factor BamB